MALFVARQRFLLSSVVAFESSAVRWRPVSPSWKLVRGAIPSSQFSRTTGPNRTHPPVTDARTVSNETDANVVIDELEELQTAPLSQPIEQRSSEKNASPTPATKDIHEETDEDAGLLVDMEAMIRQAESSTRMGTEPLRRSATRRPWLEARFGQRSQQRNAAVSSVDITESSDLRRSDANSPSMVRGVQASANSGSQLSRSSSTGERSDAEFDERGNRFRFSDTGSSGEVTGDEGNTDDDNIDNYTESDGEEYSSEETENKNNLDGGNIPELYASMPLDRSTKARLFAKGESTSNLAGMVLGDYLTSELPPDEYEANMDTVGSRLPQMGIAVDYCVFCYHGTSFLSSENGALLTKFVSEKGAILPKRFTKCCAKHQRRLARTIRRARWLNLLPWHSKLHPKLRFASLSPDPAISEGVAVVPPMTSVSSISHVGDPTTANIALPDVSGEDRSAPLTSSYAADLDVALAEIRRASSPPTSPS